MLGERTEATRRKPFRIIVRLVDDMVSGFGEGLLGIVGYDQAPKGACESDIVGGPILLLQFGYILVVYLAGPAWHRESIAIASGAPQGRWGKAAQPDWWTRFLNRLGR